MLLQPRSAQALTMPLAERRERHRALLAAVLAYDTNRWQREFLAALRDDDVMAFPKPGTQSEKPELTSGRRPFPKVKSDDRCNPGLPA
jgi:trehalose-6-phosphate synthase